MDLASPEELEAFLAHHGVKGQKWGVKKAVSKATGEARKAPVVAKTVVSKTAATAKAHSNTVTAARVALSNPQTREEAAKAAKTAFTITKLGIVPLAAATGIGIPAIAGLGISMKIISDPGVRAATVAAGHYAKDVASKVPMSSIPKMHNPFSTATSKMKEAGANNPTLKRSADGKYHLKTKSGMWVQVSPEIAKAALNNSK